MSQLENFTITRSFLPVTFQEVSVAAFREVNAGRENMLHSFCDASNVGLGVNCYVVIEGPNGTRYSELAFCKAKVLPRSQNFTTPRAELAAAVLNSGVANFIARALCHCGGKITQDILFR